VRGAVAKKQKRRASGVNPVLETSEVARKKKSNAFQQGPLAGGGRDGVMKKGELMVVQRTKRKSRGDGKSPVGGKEH